MLIEIEEVIALQQLIRELRERHTNTGVTAQTLLHRVFGHHIIDGDVLTDVANKIQEGIVFHPIVVVH